MSRASFSRSVADEGMCKDYKRRFVAPASRPRKRLQIHRFSHPLLDGAAQLAQASFKEMIGARDQDQLLRTRDRMNQRLQLGRGSELIAIATNK